MALDAAGSSRSWASGFKELGDLKVFVTLSLIGLRHGLDAVEAVHLRREVARVLKEEDPFAAESDLKTAQQHAEGLQRFAEDQKERQFSYPFSLSVIKLWSILEATIDNLAAGLLLNPENWKNPDVVRGLEGRLLEFLDASEADRADLLLIHLKLRAKAPLKKGVDRFESVLDPLGLGGEVNNDVKKSLYELSEVRNAIVHRDGRADKRLLEACPWLGHVLDSEILVSEANYSLYSAASGLYLLEINRRLMRSIKKDVTPFQQQVEAEIACQLEDLLRERTPGRSL